MSHDDATPAPGVPAVPDGTGQPTAAPLPPASPATPPPAPYVSGYEAPSFTAPASPATPTSPYGSPSSPYAPSGYPSPTYPGAASPRYPAPDGSPAGAPGQAGIPATGGPAGPSRPAGPAGAGGPGYPGPGYPGPAGPGYPGGGPYGGPPYPGQPYPGPVPGRPTDGVSIAALVTGLLFLGVVPIVLGIIGLRRTKRSGAAGRGMAIAGIVLGALEVLASIVIAIVAVVAINAYHDRVDTLRADCAGGDMAACDDLWREARAGTDDEQFGDTCGGRTTGGVLCTTLPGEIDDPAGSADPGTGSGAAPGTDPGTGSSADPGTGSSADPGTGSSEDDSTTGAQTYGEDPELDALWDACAAGDMTSCDDLFFASPVGSDYEQFGTTCGNRVDFAWSCAEEVTP